MRFFLPKSWVNPFGKHAKMRLSKETIFIDKQCLFSIEKIPTHYFKIIFAQKHKSKKSHFLTKIIGKISYVKMRLSKAHIFIGQKSFFFIEKTPKHYFKIIFAQKQKMKKMQFFDQNHGLTPFGKQAKMRLSKVTLFIGQK